MYYSLKRIITFYGFINLFLINSIIVYAQDETDCVTPNNVNGYCINIINCQSILDFIHENANSYALEFLQNSTCGFEGIYPLVCCPLNYENPVETTTYINTVEISTFINNPVTMKYFSLPNSPQCGLNAFSSNKVVNGDPARLGEFPWVAALGYNSSHNDNVLRWLCAGTLITEKHILTAGHCAYHRSDLYLVRLGDLDLNSNADGAQPIDVLIEKVVIHEQFNPTAITNDIAIVTMVKEITFGPLIRPICLPTDVTLRSQNFVRYYPFIAGWGALYFDGPPSSHLQVAMLPVVSNDQCKQAYANFKNTVIDEKVLCAGYATGAKDACQGDSGGPLMLARPHEDTYSYYQIGIVSYGYKCAEAGYPGVYSRVTAFIDWIENNLN